MSSPSLREISFFVAVYEELSFTAAAVREHTTQSGVSQHIRNLEDRLGVQLFTRQRGVRPTPAGTAYYQRCIEVLKAHAHARRTLDEFATGLSGEISVGLMPSMTRCLLAPAYLRFAAAHPNVTVHIQEAYSGSLTDSVRSGNVDFAIVPRNLLPMQGVKATLLARTPEFLVSAPNSGLPHGDTVRIADLKGLKLVVPGATNVRRAAIDNYLTANGVELRRRLEFDSMFGTLDLVRQSDWMTILPGILVSIDIESHEFTISHLDPPMMLDLILIEPEREPISAAARAFLDVLREVTDEQNATLPGRVTASQAAAGKAATRKPKRRR